ncbi:MAG TPA: PIG-L family deacetylase [Longimicrobiales bacterium]|nr:PIG-L family deacetylase [Longimicrobiales bacterium]
MRRAWRFVLELARRRRSDRAVLVLAPHPDDETIGLGGCLGRLPSARVLFLTDGAPSERALWGVRATSREGYARLRAREAHGALALCGLGRGRVAFAPGRDLETARALVPLAEHVLARARAYGCGLLVTTPYEGGHPDHDGAALVASLVRRASRGAIDVVEMASYHWTGGALVTQRFPPDGCRAVAVPLGAADRARKRAMLERYHSQRAVLRAFTAGDVEWLRAAPRYDFGAPPRAVTVLYERPGWPVCCEGWRERARAAERARLAAGAPA